MKSLDYLHLRPWREWREWRDSWLVMCWYHLIPSGELTWQWKMAIEIVDFPIKNGGSFHCYVSSPEGISFWYVWCTFQGAWTWGLVRRPISWRHCSWILVWLAIWLKPIQNKQLKMLISPHKKCRLWGSLSKFLAVAGVGTFHFNPFSLLKRLQKSWKWPSPPVNQGRNWWGPFWQWLVKPVFIHDNVVNPRVTIPKW